MLRTTCWNCGARLTRPVCQMCGSAQPPDTMEQDPAERPVVRQAQQPMRPTSPGAGVSGSGGLPGYGRGGQISNRSGSRSFQGGYGPRGPYEGGYAQPGPYEDSYGQRGAYEGSYAPDVPDQQVDRWGYEPRRPSQSAGAPPYVPGGPRQPPSAPPYVPRGHPQRAWSEDQPPQVWADQALWPQPAAPALAHQSAQPRGPEALAVPLATLGGVIGGVISAAIWAVILDMTRYNFWYIAFLLGVIVGFGVALGARGYHDIGLSLYAGALGVLTYCLALYFRLSLLESHVLGSGLNFFALSLDDFLNRLGDYLLLNPINFVNFVTVPMAAMGMAYKYINRGRDGISHSKNPSTF
jgi:hypothetical protein